MDEVCLTWRGFSDDLKYKTIIEMLSETVNYDLPLGKAIKWAGQEIPLKLLGYMDICSTMSDYMITKATNYIIDALGYDYVAEYYFKHIHHYRKLSFTTVGKTIMSGLPTDANIFNWVKNIYRAEGRHLIFVFHMCAGCYLCSISEYIHAAIDQLNKAGRMGQLKAEILKSLPDVAEDQFSIEFSMSIPLKLCGLYEGDIKKKIEQIQCAASLRESFTFAIDEDWAWDGGRKVQAWQQSDENDWGSTSIVADCSGRDIIQPCDSGCGLLYPN